MRDSTCSFLPTPECSNWIFVVMLFFAGHMLELKTEVKELESVKESSQTETEVKELYVAGVNTKGEPSAIDQILSVESEKSMPRFDGDNDDDAQQQKEVMVCLV